MLEEVLKRSHEVGMLDWIDHVPAHPPNDQVSESPKEVMRGVPALRRGLVVAVLPRSSVAVGKAPRTNQPRALERTGTPVPPMPATKKNRGQVMVPNC